MLTTILKHYGVAHQLDKACEEMGELIASIQRFKRVMDSKNPLYDEMLYEMLGELADVYNLLDQLLIAFDSDTDDAVHTYRIMKQIRELERIARKL